jgi:hypothetical protein
MCEKIDDAKKFFLTRLENLKTKIIICPVTVILFSERFLQEKYGYQRLLDRSK